MICPACGTDPSSGLPPESDPETAATFENGEAFAEASIYPAAALRGDARLEPEVDYYASDSDLELTIADANALSAALVESPILVPENKLIN